MMNRVLVLVLAMASVALASFDEPLLLAAGANRAGGQSAPSHVAAWGVHSQAWHTLSSTALDPFCGAALYNGAVFVVGTPGDSWSDTLYSTTSLGAKLHSEADDMDDSEACNGLGASPAGGLMIAGGCGDDSNILCLGSWAHGDDGVAWVQLTQPRINMNAYDTPLPDLRVVLIDPPAGSAADPLLFVGGAFDGKAVLLQITATDDGSALAHTVHAAPTSGVVVRCMAASGSGHTLLVAVGESGLFAAAASTLHVYVVEQEQWHDVALGGAAEGVVVSDVVSNGDESFVVVGSVPAEFGTQPYVAHVNTGSLAHGGAVQVTPLAAPSSGLSMSAVAYHAAARTLYGLHEKRVSSLSLAQAGNAWTALPGEVDGGGADIRLLLLDPSAPPSGGGGGGGDDDDDDSSSGGSSSGHHTAAIVGAVFGCVALAGLVGGFVWLRRRQGSGTGGDVALTSDYRRA